MNVRVALQAILSVPLGLAVPNQKDSRHLKRLPRFWLKIAKNFLKRNRLYVIMRQILLTGEIKMEMPFELTTDEKNVLESVYGRQVEGVGYNPRKLEAVKELTAQEKKFFAEKNFVSPHFFVQTLYKVRGTVSPMKFNMAVARLINHNENLRANFCNVGTRTIKVIRAATTIKPEVPESNL